MKLTVTNQAVCDVVIRDSVFINDKKDASEYFKLYVTNLGRRIRPATAARVSQLPGPERRTVPAVGRKADRVVVIFSNDRFGVLGRLISIYQRFFIADAGSGMGIYCVG